MAPPVVPPISKWSYVHVCDRSGRSHRKREAGLTCAKKIHANFAIPCVSVDDALGLCSAGTYDSYYAALLPRRGPHIALHSVCLSVCPSVRLSVRPVSGCTLFTVAPSYERTSEIEKLRFSLMGQCHVCTFRHAQRAAYRTAISAAQILVCYFFYICYFCHEIFHTHRMLRHVCQQCT